MFKNIFKSKKEVATNGKVEKLNINELKNIIGGGSGDVTPPSDPTPDGAVKVKSHSNQSNN